VDAATVVLTGLGLSGAAGLNAYIPLFVVGLLGRLEVIDLASPYDVIASTPVLIAVGALLAIEVVADKVPAVDSANDVIQTVLRPVAGALLFAGSVGALSDAPPWLGFVAGLLTAGGVHTAKAAARPVLNVGTAGVAAPVVSTAEDALSLVATVVALLAPLLILVLMAAVAWGLARLWRRRGRPGGQEAAG
jgi:hypothetical protein